MTKRVILLGALLGVLIGFGFLGMRRDAIKTTPPKIDKQPIVFARHSFDPAAPPPEMPPLNPGEAAECDTDFVSYASVAAIPQLTDATHETITITHVDVTIELHVNIWVPNGATQHMIDHEEGHRQISEHYYEYADKVAERIAATYTGKQIVVSGSDLKAESSKELQQMGADITDEYNKELNPEAAQLRYDAITDHTRNDVASGDAVAQVLRDITLPSTQSVQ